MMNDALFMKTKLSTKDSKRRKRSSKDKSSRKSSRSSSKLESKQDAEEDYHWTLEPQTFTESYQDDASIIADIHVQPPVDKDSHG